MFSKRLMQNVKSTYMERKGDTERKPLVCISGKMTGVENYNKPKFDNAKAELESKGYEVLSPADLGAEESFGWHDYMRVDVALLAMCDVIYMLDGWMSSRGARAEFDLAGTLGLMVAFQSERDYRLFGKTIEEVGKLEWELTGGERNE